jgi:hypothetical protein
LDPHLICPVRPKLDDDHLVYSVRLGLLNLEL